MFKFLAGLIVGVIFHKTISDAVDNFLYPEGE